MDGDEMSLAEVDERWGAWLNCHVGRSEAPREEDKEEEVEPV